MRPSYIKAIILILAMLAWIMSGTGGERGAEQYQTIVAGSAVEPVLLRVRNSRAALKQIQMSLPGRSEAARNLTVKSETAGKVLWLPVKKGQRVEKGELLCRLSEEERPARMQQALAAVTKAELDFESARRLARGGFQTAIEIAKAKAVLEAHKAELLHWQLELQRIDIRAPFAGIIESRSVEEGSIIGRGDSCAHLVDSDPLVLVAYVAEKDVNAITVGNAARGILITGEQVSGIVSYLSPRAGLDTRTYRMEVEVDNPLGRLPVGVTTEIRLPLQEVSAHEVPSSLLSLDDSGYLGIKIVDENRRVRFRRIEILGGLQAANGNVWIYGLDNQVTIITLGQELVTEGQLVDIDMERPRAQHQLTSYSYRGKSNEPLF